MRNPFIAGSWVRGDNFFGRARILQEILDGGRDSLWVVGARRLGKTSLLKELEYRVQQSGDTPYVSLYWDLQGSADARGLAESLLGSVEDSEPFRRATDVAIEDVEGLSAGDLLATLVRRTVRSGWRLLLLVDEAEEFLNVARSDPAILPRLRRTFQKGTEVRTVLTSTRRLARIDELTDFATSPFLQSFVPPVYLTPLSREEGRELMARGAFPAEDTELVLERTACHPFLVQLIASRLFESRDLAATLDQLAVDDMVANFFSVDFHTLEGMERSILEDVAREGALDQADLSRSLGRPEEALEPSLFGLRQMGYLATDGSRYRLGNWFFERWLKRVGARAAEAQAGMIVGSNRVFEHQGKAYHIQVEDLGLDQAAMEVRVYDGGTVLWRKRIPYADLLARGLDKLTFEDELRALMERTIQTVQAAIAKGKLA